MRLLIILSFIIAIQGAALNSTEEQEITINGIHYIKEVLKTNIDRPWSLAIDAKHTLYFSYTVNDEVLKTAKIEIDTKRFKELQIENGFTQTVDRMKNITYIGTSNGIHKYDQNTNEASVVLVPGNDIWEVYYNNVLHYTDFLSQYLYTLIDDTPVRFTDLNHTKVYHFCIDGDGEMFYTNVIGLYSKKSGGNSVLYKELENSDDVRAIVTDAEGRAFVCLDDGIYKVDKTKTALEKVLDVSDCFGLAFDARNRIVYSDANSLVFLKPKSDECCVY